MQFRMTPAPFQRQRRTTSQIMVELFLVLCAVWVYAIVFNFVNVGWKNGLSIILIGLVSVLVSCLCDVIVGLIQKKPLKELPMHILKSYSYVTGIIFALCLPANTSLFVVICGSLFGTLFGKLVFGGFGHNIVNPAGIGRIFVALSFSLGITLLPGAAPDFQTGATITGAIDWTTGFIPGGYNLLDLFLGQYIGAIGETSTLVLLIAAGILIWRGIINYRVFGAYVGTSFIIAFILGLVLKVDFVLTYALTHIFAGGLMFGAVFMITDPVTSPTSSLGKIIYAVGAAMLTMLIRVCGSLPEGVVFSIVIMNFMVPLIDGAIKGRTTDKVWKSWVTVAVAVVIAVLVNVGFALL